MNFSSLRVAITSIAFAFATCHAGTTVLEFDDAGTNNNDPVPESYASAAAENTSGITVTDGGTPDIDVFWEGSGDMWDYHTADVWAALDSAGNVNIAQMDWHMDLAIAFVTTQADTVFQLAQFELGNATDQSEAAYGWDISLRNLSSDEIVATQTSSNLGAGGTTTVVFDYTGDPGVDYLLEFVPNATDFPADGDGNQFVFRTAIDALEFSQNPETSGLACDIDADGDCDAADIDLLYAMSPNAEAISTWLAEASDPSNPYKAAADDTYVVGDANLDGDVNSTDLGLLLNNFDSMSDAGWGGGDLNADGSVTSTDLGLLLNNFNSAGVAVAVPEPSGLAVYGLLVVFFCFRRHK